MPAVGAANDSLELTLIVVFAFCLVAGRQAFEALRWARAGRTE